MPAVRLRSLIAVGTPYSGELRPPGSGASSDRARAARQVVGERDERAHVVVGASMRRGSARRARPATPHRGGRLALLEGGQVVQLGHLANYSSDERQAATVSCMKSTSWATAA